MNSPARTLELVPLEPAPTANPDSAPVPVAPPARAEVIEVVPVAAVRHDEVHGAVPSADRFAREAAQQYAEGHIDQPLWDRAVAQAGGDHDKAVQGYLRARATALRLIDRESRTEQRARLTRPVPSEASRPPPIVITDFDEQGAGHDAGVDKRQFERRRLLAKYRTPLLAAAVGIPVLIIAGWLIFGRSSGADADAAPRTAAAAPQRTAAAAPAPAKSAALSAAEKAAVNAEFMLKLQQFRDTGNWNMVVLYSVEWTRREPGNAAAWNELRGGYVNLRQYEDALAAAKKAVELAPAEAALWRHLGNAHLDIDDPAAALAAFTEAAARDADDTYSLQQIGLLDARLGRLPEARAAFDLALAAKPGDGLTQCLKAGVAQLSPAKDPHAAVLQVRAVDSKCRGGDVATEAVAPVVATQRPGERSAKRAAPRS